MRKMPKNTEIKESIFIDSLLEIFTAKMQEVANSDAFSTFGNMWNNPACRDFWYNKLRTHLLLAEEHSDAEQYVKVAVVAMFLHLLSLEDTNVDIYST